MVRLLAGGPGGTRGKLSGDPAITTAAVALLSGWSDPLELLAQDPADFAISSAVIREADRLRVQRDTQYADYQAAKTSGLTVAGILRGLHRMFR